jgi:hypothetical protein
MHLIWIDNQIKCNKQDVTPTIFANGPWSSKKIGIYKHIQIGNGHSIADDSYSAGIEAATSAIESIAAFPISVVLVFASVRYNFSKLLKGVGSIVGKVPVIGSSTAGEIYNQPFNRSVVVVVLALLHDVL